MNKLERYHRYVVDDMVKNTVIINKGNYDIVQFPYFLEDWYYRSIIYSEIVSNTWINDFGEYVSNMYGVKETEWKSLYVKYLKSLV